jgi:hypothetical protein
MRLGILSDTHNDVGKTQAALAVFRAREVHRLVHCGDLTTPKMIELFEGWDSAFVYGNIDRDLAGLARAVARTDGPHHIGFLYEALLDGVRVGGCHGHDSRVLDVMTESGKYDLICHGHFHSQRDDMVGRTRVVSPGALGGPRSEPCSVCIVDLATSIAEFAHV